MKNQYKMRKFNCIGCGKEVEERRPKNKLKYCSLGCYRVGKRPGRMTGEIVSCSFCGKEVYKKKMFLGKGNLFCSKDCHKRFQVTGKIKFVCKICGGEFWWSRSRLRQANPIYCSMRCRNKDKERLLLNSIKGNLAQLNKQGLNRLELSGREILEDIGVEFREQVLMFNKFLVDVLIPDVGLIIQWDGEYWHSRPDRRKLDVSQDAYFKKCGYRVLRFTDKDIYGRREGVYADIKRAIR